MTLGKIEFRINSEGIARVVKQVARVQQTLDGTPSEFDFIFRRIPRVAKAQPWVLVKNNSYGEAVAFEARRRSIYSTIGTEPLQGSISCWAVFPGLPKLNPGLWDATPSG